ncbi:MAG: hypothetical protein CBE47_01810 [Pelagibacteraceae bacterium TMED287]|nr:MAG: hypothetical protein CBE47_01810 [Pelagibacteraceae bacterium TMED287]
MHYFEFAEKDATLYEASQSLNSGLDEILEVRKDISDTATTIDVSRALIKFDLTEISESIVAGIIPDSGSKAARYYLNLFDAKPTSLASSQSLFAYPVSQSWVMGDGRSYDNPITTDGCSWTFSKGQDDGTLWTPELSASGATWYQNFASGSFTLISGSTGNFGTSSNDEVQLTVAGTEFNFIATASIDATGTGSVPDDTSPNFFFNTGSITSEFASNLADEINAADIGITASFSSTSGSLGAVGTVNLHLTASSITTAGLTDISIDTGSSGNYSDILTLGGGGVPYEASQSFTQKSEDVRMDVTYIVQAWLSQSIDNEGFLIKRRGNVGNSDKFSDENNKQDLGNFSFFSSDTHTKYPPTLEVVWDDSKWRPGTLEQLSSTELEDTVVYMKGLRPDYKEKSKARFRVVGRARFPETTYSTTPANLTVKVLPPSSSFYSILDAETDDVIVPYGSGSKLSCDSNGNYFNLDLNGFQPERYYKIEYRIQSGSKTEDELNLYYDEGFTFKVSL